MKSKLPLLFLLAAMLCGCSNSDKPQVFDYGHVAKGKYVNTYFNFEIAIPTGWSVQTKEQMDAIANVGKELVAGSNEQMKAVLKASDVNSANLLAVYQHELGAAVAYNPNFGIVAENIKNYPGIKTGGDYLFQARKFMEQSQIKYSHIDRNFTRETINGTDFYLMNASVSYMGLSIRQTYYATVQKGFGFLVIISYANDEQQRDLQKTIVTMRFGN